MLAALLLLLDLETQIASRDVEQRLLAVAAILEKGHENAEALLLDALKDSDWEVVHRAAAALGTRGGARAVAPLVSVALRGPVRRIRLAAAVSLARIDRAGAAERIDRRLRGQTALAAADAAEQIAHATMAKSLRALLKNRDGAVRAQAVRALGAIKDPEQVELFAELLHDKEIRVRAAATAALVMTGTSNAVGPLRDGLKAEKMTNVMERRHIVAITRIIKGMDARQQKFQGEMCARSFGMGGDVRFARLLASLGKAKLGPVAEYLKVLKAGCGNPRLEVRRVCVWGLGEIGDVSAYEKVANIAKGDAEEKVRFHALRAAVRLKGKEAETLVVDRIRYDESPIVREEACVLASRRRMAQTADVLIERLGDESWEVCVAAAVSLGKLRVERAVVPLAKLLKHKGWRRRGAGVAGLGWCHQKQAVPALIGALRDREPAVAATAAEFLRHLSGQPLDAKPKSWKAWWAKAGAHFTFRDQKEEARQAKKYGYAITPTKVYEDLDIVVLQTRKGGDNIQFLLKDYEIEFRLIRAASINKVGLHPHALFVANCPGEITKKDAERLKWYVRGGGYLFASCWALTHTVNRCFPEIVEHYKTRAQVLDVVEARPCPANSPLILGVFDGVTRPKYMLEGSHMIGLIDPERFEVLIDSPEAATRWGEGNLAGWFTIGHGLVLDSANHFDLQGMVRAKLRDEKERMAFAVDHLGYDYAKLRKLRADGVFKKQPEAIRRTRDLSTFRFITTFVRQKRLADAE